MSAPASVQAALPMSPIRPTGRPTSPPAQPSPKPSRSGSTSSVGAATTSMAIAPPIVLDQPLSLQPPPNAILSVSSGDAGGAKQADTLAGGVHVAALPLAPPPSAVPVHADAQEQAKALAAAQSPAKPPMAPHSANPPVMSLSTLTREGAGASANAVSAGAAAHRTQPVQPQSTAHVKIEGVAPAATPALASAPSGLSLALKQERSQIQGHGQGSHGSAQGSAQAQGSGGRTGAEEDAPSSTVSTPVSTQAETEADDADSSGMAILSATQRFAPLKPPADPSAPVDPCLTGTWLLDKERSEPMHEYFRAMGLPELAIEAAAKAEVDFDTWNVVTQHDDRFCIKKHGRLIHSDETFIYSKEYNQTSKIGCKCITVTKEGRLVLRQTLLPNNSKLEERRQKLDHVTMHIVFKLTTPDTIVVINRYYLSMPPEAFNFSDYD